MMETEEIRLEVEKLIDKFGFIVFDIIKDIQFSKMTHIEQRKYLQRETRGVSSY